MKKQEQLVLAEILLQLAQQRSLLTLRFAQNVIHFTLEKKNLLIPWEEWKGLKND